MKLIETFLEDYGISCNSYKKLEGYGSLNYKIEGSDGQIYLLKIYQATEDKELILEEIELIDFFSKKVNCKFTKTIRNKNGNLLGLGPDSQFCRLLNYLEGNCLTSDDLNETLLVSLGSTIGMLHKQAPRKSFPNIAARELSWDLKQINSIAGYIDFIRDPHLRSIVLYYLDAFQNKVIPHMHNYQSALIHNDLNEQNLIVQDQELVGIIDYGDAVRSPLIFDLGIALCYLLMLNQDFEFIISKVLNGYANKNKFEDIELDALYYVVGARLSMSLCHSAKAKAKQMDTDYITGSESSASSLIEHWLSVNPVRIQQIAYKAFGKAIPKYPGKKIEDKRKSLFPTNLSTSYKEAIHFHSAAFQYMYDQEGNTYLDAYNNIPIVGHSHPKISRIVSEQIRNLQTNTRYHYEVLSRYAGKLLSLCPSHFSKVLFVNSGSAATDLALRIVKTHTTKKKIVILEQGYHGNTELGIQISDYKISQQKDSSFSEHIIRIPLAYNDNRSSAKALELLESQHDQIACIIVEPISGCGGQVPLDSKYFQAIDAFAKRYKVLLIVDEVQTGFGRTGENFWAHEHSNITADIMILGKAMGNGHPIGAVLMTDGLAKSFDNGMEFFSSFGGNPVSCFVGEAVIDIIREENLQEKAHSTGEYFINQLKLIAKDFLQISDVRGRGLFLGIEFKEDHKLAKYIKEFLKSNYILSSTDGKLNEVIKIKPSLKFNKKNVDRFCQVLRQGLQEYNAH